MSSSQSINDLFQAVLRGNIEEVKRLISEGADVNAKDDNKQTPLHRAAENGNKDVVEALLNNGANVNAVDKDRKTPFDLTTDEEIKTLLQNTAELLEAAVKGDIDAVTRLISEGADSVP